MKRIRAFVSTPARIALLALLGAITVYIAQPIAQGIPWVYPTAGPQPAAQADWSNPPLTYAPQGLTSAFMASAQPQTIPIGSVAYGSVGNATTYVGGTIYTAEIFVPADMTTTNCNFLTGATVGTNTVICVLYNTAGSIIRTTALAGTATSGANSFQQIAWTSPVALQGPGRYFIAVQANGTTDNFRSIAASTFIGTLASSATGTFGTITALTPPTTFTANVGPIAFLN